ncbi:hypothetical protein [Streptomyces lydicus]|uniref:hypothetical protein n=1 Tax=Streptomyces lydicus TaxID=47763 RepID=UPI00378AAE46
MSRSARRPGSFGTGLNAAIYAAGGGIESDLQNFAKDADEAGEGAKWSVPRQLNTVNLAGVAHNNPHYDPVSGE